MSAEVSAIARLDGSNSWTEETDFTDNTLPAETVAVEIAAGTVGAVITVTTATGNRSLTLNRDTPIPAHITAIVSLDSGTLTRLRCWYLRGTPTS